MGLDRRSAIGALVVGLVLVGAAPASAAPHVQVSAGGGHTCAVKLDQTLVCWGLNADGQATPPAGTFTRGERREPPHVCDQDRRHGRLLGPRRRGLDGSAHRGLHCGQRRRRAHLRDPDQRHPRLLGGQRPFVLLPAAGRDVHQRQRGRLQRFAVRVCGQHRPDARVLGIQRLRPGVAADRDLPRRRRRGRPYVRDEDRRLRRVLGFPDVRPDAAGYADRHVRRAERRL